MWRSLTDADFKAVSWLVKRKDVKMVAAYRGGPGEDPFERIKHNRAPNISLIIKDPLSVLNWGIFVPSSLDEWLMQFAGAPKSIEKTARKIFNNHGLINLKEPRSRGVFVIPAGTEDVASFLSQWAKNELDDLLSSVTARAQRLRQSGTFYFAGKPGLSPGDVIKPYYKPKTSGLLDDTTSFENWMLQFRPSNKHIGRLHVSYAFEDPQDAVEYAYGSTRQLYAVVPEGQVERRDMMCIDAIDHLEGLIKIEKDNAEYGDGDYDRADEEVKPLEAAQKACAQAYWTGKPVPFEVDGVSTGVNKHVWEIVCADGFRVVNVEKNVAESLLRRFVENTLRSVQ